MSKKTVQTTRRRTVDDLIEEFSEAFPAELDIATLEAGLSKADAAEVYRGIMAELQTRAESLETEAERDTEGDDGG